MSMLLPAFSVMRKDAESWAWIVPLPSALYSPAILSFSVPLTLLGCLLSLLSLKLFIFLTFPLIFSHSFFSVGPLCACVSLGWTQGLTHWARPALLFPPALSLPTISLHLCLHSHGQTLAWLCIKPHCLYQLDRPRTEKLRTKPKETKPKPVRKDRGSHIIVCCRPFKAG